MARKPSIASLTRKVRMLESNNEAFDRICADMRKQRDEAREEAKQTKERANMWYDRQREKDAERKEAQAKADALQRQLDAANQQLSLNAEQRQFVERERDEARIYAEQMRQQAFPLAPQFPWEAQEVLVTGRPDWTDWRGPQHG